MTATKLRHPDVSPTMDLIAKKVFSRPHLTADFIKHTLGLPVTSVKILKETQVHLPNDDTPLFFKAVDVRAEIEDGTQVIIEIQVVKQNAFINRILSYIAKEWTDKLEELRKEFKTHSLYKELSPIYSIAILEQAFFEDEDAFRTYSLRSDQLPENQLLSPFRQGDPRPPIRLAFLELSKYNLDRISDYDLQKWFEFFRNQPYEVAPDAVIEEAEELLDQTHWT